MRMRQSNQSCKSVISTICVYNCHLMQLITQLRKDLTFLLSCSNYLSSVVSLTICCFVCGAWFLSVCVRCVVVCCEVGVWCIHPHCTALYCAVVVESFLLSTRWLLAGVKLQPIQCSAIHQPTIEDFVSIVIIWLWCARCWSSACCWSFCSRFDKAKSNQTTLS